jgi:cell wall-associated NlpC family hydrolase
MKKKRTSSSTVTTYKSKQSVSKAVKPLLNRKYELGGNGTTPGGSFDCFGMMVEYIYYRFGVKLFDLHSKENFNFHGYATSFKVKPVETKKELLKYLENCFLRVATNYIMSGDLLWCETDNIEFVGVYCGNQRMVITTPETGCVVIGTEHYNIKDSFRCPLQSP